ncbi:hypothetical protein BYT27DRAFT_7249622 [Phlegmacium glaucopus]|nr:hypothetical protein BYT27DRAFT_7249622 [Phlegmacium glaucopus]
MLDKNYNLTGARNALEQSAVERHRELEDNRLASMFKTGSPSKRWRIHRVGAC